MASLELISLNRNARIRVKTTSGGYQNLSTTASCWVNINDTYNRKQLNHHSSVGQFLAIAASTGISTGSTNLLTTYRDIPLVGLNTAYTGTNKSNVRVKDSNGDEVNLLVDDYTWVPVGGNNDETRAIASYNRRQLNHHRSIGQYVHGAGVQIRALNRSAKLRVWNSNTNEYEMISSTEASSTFYPEDNEKTRLTLNHHSAIGQYIPVMWD